MKCDIVIFVDEKFLNKAISRIKEFEYLGIENFRFYCLDNKTYDLLPTDKKIRSILDKGKHFRQRLWLYRTTIIRDILDSTNKDIFHIDVDAEWKKSPFEIISEHTDTDIFLTPGLDFPRDIFIRWGFVVRGGCYYFKNSKKNLSFIDEWINGIKIHNDDQIALNHLLYQKNITWNIPVQDIKHLTYQIDPQYSFLFSKQIMYGYFDDYKLALMSAYDFPRLLTKHDSYIVDLHYTHEIYGSMPE